MSHNMSHHRDLNGLLVISKPKGWTSFDVVAKIRNKLKVKKIGHTGTLDPMATGVLVLCLGKATKKAQEIAGTDKEYIAEITLGATSTTDDTEGEIICDSRFMNHESKIITKTSIEKVLEKFQGTIEQIPPDFSAKKIKGQRAYKLARKGKEVELKPVKVTIHELKIIDYKWPVIDVRALCSKGTYIRSLARDIGKELGTGGYLSKLKRTKVGQYSIDQAIEVSQVGIEHVLSA